MMQPVGILAAGPGGAIFSSSAAMVLLVACLCSAPAAVIGWFRRLLAFPLWVLHAGADSFEKHYNFEQAPALLTQPPAQGPLKRLTVVLDLDETLVSSHLTSSLPANLRDQAIEAGVKCCDIDFASLDKRFGGMQNVRFTIFERPGLQEFLRQISDFADIIVFTAGNEDMSLTKLMWIARLNIASIDLQLCLRNIRGTSKIFHAYPRIFPGLLLSITGHPVSCCSH